MNKPVETETASRPALGGRFCIPYSVFHILDFADQLKRGPVASATCRCLVTLVTNSLDLLVFLLLRFRRTPTTIPFAPPMLCVGDVIPPVRM